MSKIIKIIRLMSKYNY